MNKTFLGASIAFIFLLCVIISVIAYFTTDEAVFALIAVIFAFGVIAGIGYAVEDTDLADVMASVFGEEVNNE